MKETSQDSSPLSFNSLKFRININFMKQWALNTRSFFPYRGTRHNTTISGNNVFSYNLPHTQHKMITFVRATTHLNITAIP